MVLFENQTRALDYLEDTITGEIVYGGGAGGGKTRLGCYWIIKNCLRYPGSRWLIGRAVYSNLMQTTWKSFVETAIAQGLIQDVHFWYVEGKKTFYFENKSEVIFKDLEQQPSDPTFVSLGGFEITGAFIDECNEIVKMAWDIVRSRIRYKLSDFCHNCAYPTKDSKVLEVNKLMIPVKWLCKKCKKETKGLSPKILGSCNPAPGWVYKDFYEPFKSDKLSKKRKFVQSLVDDNPYNHSSYVDTLMSLDKASVERLRYGNWDFNDDKTILCNYDSILDTFTNDFCSPNGPRYLSCDVAGLGRDSFIIAFQQGSVIEIVVEEGKTTGLDTISLLKEALLKYKVPQSNLVVDSDGIGQGVTGWFHNYYSFHGGGASFDKRYKNIKAECAYALARKINNHQIKIIASNAQRERIIEELMALKAGMLDMEGKMTIISKDDMRRMLDNRHSPDFFDALMMLQVFDLQYQPLRIVDDISKPTTLVEDREPRISREEMAKRRHNKFGNK